MTSSWQPISGGLTAPQGFLASGITAGLKPSGNPDLSLLLAPERAVCAGSFTTSLVRAACVDLCAERLAARGGHARAVLTNSGQAILLCGLLLLLLLLLLLPLLLPPSSISISSALPRPDPDLT